MSELRELRVVDTVLPLVRQLVTGKQANEPLAATGTEGRLYATAFKRSTNWQVTGRGRRLHDLRHTAACLWLEAGVSPTTVQAWLGHADLSTTQQYLHYLGTSADEAAVHRANRWGTRSAPQD